MWRTVSNSNPESPLPFMRTNDTSFGGVHLVHHEIKSDMRGNFRRIFCRKFFQELGLNCNWPQINTSHTLKRGTLRGLHFQKSPSGEAKLVTCLTGEIYDVVVDIRVGSVSFGQWRVFKLHEQGGNSLYIPQGFAHGFQSLTDDCRVSYMMSSDYDSALSSGIRYNDPKLSIPWPLQVTCISSIDENWPLM